MDRSDRRGLVGIAGFTAGQVGPDATLVQHARELRGLGRTPASTHADYADLRNWSLFEPQFGLCGQPLVRSEEHTSELQSLMCISYAVFCLKHKKTTNIVR